MISAVIIKFRIILDLWVMGKLDAVLILKVEIDIQGHFDGISITKCQ